MHSILDLVADYELTLAMRFKDEDITDTPIISSPSRVWVSEWVTVVVFMAVVTIGGVVIALTAVGWFVPSQARDWFGLFTNLVSYL